MKIGTKLAVLKCTGDAYSREQKQANKKTSKFNSTVKHPMISEENEIYHFMFA